VHSKLEAIQNSKLVKEKNEASQVLSKRVFKKCNHKLCAHELSKWLKDKRYLSRAKTMVFLEGKPHVEIISSHDKSKAGMLANSTNE
jgi:hypothetical protein